MIHIVTPCSRPENLEYIRATIPPQCSWLVVLDFSTSKKQIPKGIQVMRSNLGGAWGHPLRNEAIEHLQPHQDDYIYFLDDDNIIHPKWYEAVKDSTEDIVTWGQVNKDGTVRLRPTDQPIPGTIDTASFMCKMKAIGSIRFEMNYEADGVFAYQVARNVKPFKINDYLCYYNYLR